jgi:hypothetical protein
VSPLQPLPRGNTFKGKRCRLLNHYPEVTPSKAKGVASSTLAQR